MYNMKVLNMDVREPEDTRLPGTSVLQHKRKHRWCKDNLLEDLKPKIWLLQAKEKITLSIQRSGNTEQTQKFSKIGDIKILEEQRNGNLNTLMYE